MSEAAAGAPARAPRAAWREHAAGAACAFYILAAIGSFTSPPLCNIGAGLALLAFCFVPGALARLRAVAAQPVARGALALLAVLAVAMLWADAPWPRRLASWWSWRPLLLLAIGAALFADARWKDRGALALVLALAAATLLSFALRLAGVALPVAVDEPGIVLRNHTTQGMALVVGIVLALVLGWGRPATAARRRLMAAAIAMFVANLAFVVTGRSAHLALLVVAAVLAFALVRGRRRWLAPVAIVVLGVALLASSSMVRERFETAYSEFGAASSPKETSMGIRKVIWKSTIELIARRPVLGYGVGGFAPAYAQYAQEHLSGWEAQEVVKDTHDQYLHLWVEGGIPALLAFAAFVAGACRQPAPMPYRAAALALLAAWLATSLLNSHFQAFAEAHLLGLVLGMLLAVPSAGGAQGAASAASTAASTSP